MMPNNKATRASANSALLAEQIMQGIMGGDTKPPTTQSPSTQTVQEFSRKVTSGPNLKNIKISDNLVESIVNFATKKTPESIVEEERVDEEELVQDRLSDLVNRLTALLKEAKEFVTEMTTTGMIGVGPMKSKKKKTMRKP
jgi:hypothetical protein